MMTQVEGDILRILCDGDDIFTQRMSNSRFIEHIRVPAREIADDDVRPENKGKYVLDHRRVVPYIIGALAGETNLLGRRLDRLVNWLQSLIERHHYGQQIDVWLLVRHGEDCRRENDTSGPIVCARDELAPFWTCAADIVEHQRVIVWPRINHVLEHLKSMTFVIVVVPAQAAEQTRVSVDCIEHLNGGTKLSPVGLAESTHHLILQRDELSPRWFVSVSHVRFNGYMVEA